MRAVKHAIRLAQSRRTRLHLLNVEPELDDYGMVRAYLTRSKYQKLMAARAHALLNSAERVLRKAKVQHSSHVA
jgi:nucleotide-binding universal stress UspA family protein